MPEKCYAIGCTKPSVSKGLCDTHRKRRDRHGHVNQTRADDWGQREKHKAYGTWNSMRRYHRQNMPEEWLDDFWAFVHSVPDKPEVAQAYRLRKDQPWGPDNFYWKEPRLSKAELGSKAAYQREWHRQAREANPDYYRNVDLKKNYGVTLDWYNQKLKEQGEVCAICKQPETTVIKGRVLRLSVDHCHDKGHARGLLCRECNQAIGLLHHDRSRVAAAYLYLEETE